MLRRYLWLLWIIAISCSGSRLHGHINSDDVGVELGPIKLTALDGTLFILESDVCIDVVSIFVNVSGDDSRSLGGLEVGSSSAAKPHRFNIAILFELSFNGFDIDIGG